MTVLPPKGSDFVVRIPRGLFIIMVSVAAGLLRGLPSIAILSLEVAFVPSSVTTFPFTETRPSVISFSAARREQKPAEAISFWRRASWFVGFFVGSMRVVYTSARIFAKIRAWI